MSGSAQSKPFFRDEEKSQLRFDKIGNSKFKDGMVLYFVSDNFILKPFLQLNTNYITFKSSNIENSAIFKN